jgi:hypothetical protein
MYIKPGAVVVPGLTGRSTPPPPGMSHYYFILCPVDSHVHALEYGAQRQIPMEEARNALGEPASFASYKVQNALC